MVVVDAADAVAVDILLDEEAFDDADTAVQHAAVQDAAVQDAAAVGKVVVLVGHKEVLAQGVDVGSGRNLDLPTIQAVDILPVVARTVLAAGVVAAVVDVAQAVFDFCLAATSSVWAWVLQAQIVR